MTLDFAGSPSHYRLCSKVKVMIELLKFATILTIINAFLVVTDIN